MTSGDHDPTGFHAAYWLSEQFDDSESFAPRAVNFLIASAEESSQDLFLVVTNKLDSLLPIVNYKTKPYTEMQMITKQISTWCSCFLKIPLIANNFTVT